MIPRLDQYDAVRDTYLAFLEALPGAGFGGLIRVDYGTRLVTATDNSVYQILPQAVVFPKKAADVQAFCRLAFSERFRDTIQYSPRGGGTGTNGQSLCDGIIVDVSRYMNRILEVNLDEGWARVEPGVVLDQLNDHVRPHGVFFAPNLSPSSRATVGGMIATDACGKGSRIYGRTSQHVQALDVVLVDGTAHRFEPTDAAGLVALRERDDRVGHVHRVVHDAVTKNAALIVAQFPRLDRFMTGYNLAMVRDEAGASRMPYLLAGSEGTLGLTTEARLTLTKLPAHKQLVVLKYASFQDALADAQVIARSGPGAIETIDERVLGLAREDVIYYDVKDCIADEPGQPTQTINLVEFWSADAGEVEGKVAALIAAVDAHRGESGHAVGYHAARNAAETRALWALRKKGVGLLGNTKGKRRPVAFMEDTAVPPERLPEYVRELRAILDAEGLEYGMFGHIDVGCLHVRPALDMEDPEDDLRLRRVSDAVCDLVQRYGGVMWAEHGKGFRSEYNPRFFGPELSDVLREVKAAFDPANQLNPGKLAVPAGVDGELVSVDGPKRGTLDRQIPVAAREAFALALRCNGNGQCFDYHPDHVMCPSSKITRDRVHSPKGRAGVLREWLRLLAAAGHDPMESPPRPWWSAPARFVKRSWATMWAKGDYSTEVYAAMSGCLSCKACATHCPIKVDVPSFKAEFLERYHGRYLRPARDHLVAILEPSLRWLGRFPALGNALAFSNPLSRWLLKRLGVVDSPRLARASARNALERRKAPVADPAILIALPGERRERAVILLQDAFTTYYDAQVLVAVYDLLRALGFEPHVAPYFANGKGLHVKGFVGRFGRMVRKNAAILRALAATGVPLVGVDPAVVLTYRDEYPAALGTSDTGFTVHLLQEWLVGRIPATFGRAAGAAAAPGYTLFGHCTERTYALASQAQWQQVFAALGLSLELTSLGCCGMCGMFGHEREHREESRGIFELSWARALPEGAEERAQVLATGHSCRHQVERFAGFLPRHPAEVLAAHLAEAHQPRALTGPV